MRACVHACMRARLRGRLACLEAIKVAKAAGHAGAAKRRRLKVECLREREPWL